MLAIRRLVAALNRYRNVRSAGLRGWMEDGSAIYFFREHLLPDD